MEDSKNGNIETSKEKNKQEGEIKKSTGDQFPPPMKPEEKKEDNNFILQYSPRTEYSVKLQEEEEMYSELKQNFGR